MDWSETEVRAFIADQINYYGFEVSPEQTKEGISPWKLWLWLEKNGFDFAYVSLEQEIAQFRVKEDPFGVPLACERRLLLAVRDVMRDILSLPPLDAEARARLLATMPTSNWSHWAAVRRPYGSDGADATADHSDVIAFIWESIRQERPDYLTLLRRIRDASGLERFSDPYTINGTYDLSLSPVHLRTMVHMVTRHHRMRAYDMFFAPGSLKMHDMIATLFGQSVEDYLGRG